VRLSELEAASLAERTAIAAEKARGGTVEEQAAAAAALASAALLRAARDPVKWWSAAVDLPLLRAVFRRTATMQVSSIASERVFSQLKLLLGRLRHSLADSCVDDFVVSAGNFRGLLSTFEKLDDDATEDDIDVRQAVWDEAAALAAELGEAQEA
jgi:hypothetical protein